VGGLIGGRVKPDPDPPPPFFFHASAALLGNAEHMG
jgi:hypothetical protein